MSRRRADLARAEACIDTQAARIGELADENRVLRSILRKLAAEGDVELREYGPGRPDKAGERFLGLDYSAVDLTADEAALFDTITEEST